MLCTLQAQAADLKEKRLKEELEKKRREGYELEKKRLEVSCFLPAVVWDYSVL